MHVLPQSTTSPRLDVATLGLEGQELEIARVIAEETENQRELLRQAIDVAPEAANLARAENLIGIKYHFADTAPWDELLLDGIAVFNCAARVGVPPIEVLRVATDKCNPRSWRALFWFEQWLRATAVGGPAGKAAVSAVIDKADREAARRYGATGLDKRWEPYRKAKEFVRLEWAKQKNSYGGKKAPFARAIIAQVKQQFSVDDITPRTITEDYLASF